MTQSVNRETGWMANTDQMTGTETIPNCIEMRTNIDGTLDYVPLPLAMRNVWLFNNVGERNDVY